MVISITMIILIVLCVAGIVWAYPKLPAPWNLVLVIIVAIVCVVILLNLSGVIHVGVTG